MAKKPARQRSQPDPADRSTNIPQIWNGLVYSELLNDFTRRIESAFEDLHHSNYTEVIRKAKYCRHREVPRLRDEGALANSSTKKSQLFRAFKNGRDLIRALGIQNPKVEKLAADIKGSAASFHAAQQDCVRQLQSMLPHADDTGHMTWPPPVPAHLAINAFVSLSLRIHTEKPTLKPNAVMLVAARKTIVPVLAHWLCVSGISGRANFHGIKTIRAFFDRQPPPTVDTEDPDTLFNELAWQRLAKVLAEATREVFGADAPGLLNEVMELIESHIENPHGGRLWSMMGKLNGTPPGANLLVVFECLNELSNQDDHAAQARTHDSTYYCSRIRYDAVRLGHYDEAFKKAAASSIDGLEQALRKAAKATPEEKLSMAFILSRRALLAAEDDERTLQRKKIIAQHTVALLEEVAKGAAVGSPLKEIADRYLLGFHTNPRFVKYLPNLIELETRLEAYGQHATTCASGVPTLMWHIFRARLNWAKALSGLKIDCANEVIGLYAKACEALFASIESSGQKAGDKGRRDAFDSEAPIWVLPELSVLIWAGDTFDNRLNLQKRLAAQAGKLTTTQKKFENAATILTRIAETEFGIYCHHATERKRILTGILYFAKIVSEARYRP